MRVHDIRVGDANAGEVRPKDGHQAAGPPPTFGPEKGASIEYLLVVPVPFHRTAQSTVATESAFCEHLRMLRRMLAPTFASLTIASPAMDPARYERDRGQLGSIDEESDGIRWVNLHPAGAGRLAFWRRDFLPAMRRLWREVRRADVVHSGTSHNLFRPIEFSSLVMAKLLRRKSICVVDMDLRDEARMNYATGKWSRTNLLVCRSVYDPLRHVQLRLAAQQCSLVLLKGRRLCRDYGRGRAHVKYFLDAAFSAEHMIPPEALALKVRDLEDPDQPLQLVYFGRLTASKGIDRCIEAVARARQLTTAPMQLHIIGAGEEAEALRRLSEKLRVDDAVTFHGPLPFGPTLFRALYPMHLLLAAPMIEDTPRSALDALACGVPILSFATDYYTDLKESGAVDLVPWLSVERMADRIAHYAQNKQELAPRARCGVEFARTNTQEQWLASRTRWTLAVVGAEPSADRTTEDEVTRWRRAEST